MLLPDIAFTDGVISFNMLGQSSPPQSNFLGVTFRALDSHAHEVVYFQPFNFRAEEEQRRIHAVQYVSYPEYLWFSLREEQPEKYEQPVTPAPDGDGWFGAKVTIKGSCVRVYVNDEVFELKTEE